MKYWLHRIGYLQNVSYPLLEKGYLSIGFADFCYEDFFVNVAENQDWEYMENAFNENWGFVPRIRYNLWRFLAEMSKGDYIVVPSWGTFSIYELCDNLPLMITDNIPDLPTEDWNGNKILKNEKTCLLKLDGEKKDLDLGFLWKVKVQMQIFLI